MKIFNLKSVLQVALLVSIIFVSACGDDEGESGGVNFIDQNLQGSIDGVDFNLGEAKAVISNGTISVDMFDTNEEIDDVCTAFGGDEVRVFFSIPSEVGVTNLNLDFTSGQTITLFNPATTLNIIAAEGAIEILTITETQVTGRIDARAGDGDQVNGNFTLTICN